MRPAVLAVLADLAGLRVILPADFPAHSVLAVLVLLKWGRLIPLAPKTQLKIRVRPHFLLIQRQYRLLLHRCQQLRQ